MARIVIIFIYLLLVLNGKVFSQEAVMTPGIAQEMKLSSGEFREQMNTLWQENSFWSRNLMLCMIDTLQGKDQAMWRLIKNQEEICGLFKNYFGTEAGIALTELFYSDLNFQIEVISASATDSILAKQAKERWHKSANTIAEYLHQLNPKWMLKEMKTALNQQVDMSFETIKQRIVRDFDLEVIAFDKMIHNGNKISSMLSKGIIFLYPQKFTDLTTRIAVK
jgi:hypothetical protein